MHLFCIKYIQQYIFFKTLMIVLLLRVKMVEYVRMALTTTRVCVREASQTTTVQDQSCQ